MHLNCLHNEYEKKITKLSVQKNLDGSWWLNRTSISNYIFFFLFSYHFFLQSIVQYLHLQIKSFLIPLSTCNICFVSLCKLIVLYISNIQKQFFWKHIQKDLRFVFCFFLTGLNPLKHLKKFHGGIEAFWKKKHAVLQFYMVSGLCTSKLSPLL